MIFELGQCQTYSRQMPAAGDINTDNCSDISTRTRGIGISVTMDVE
jgi:hypothetical protein